MEELISSITQEILAETSQPLIDYYWKGGLTMETLVNAKDLVLFWVQPRATRRNFILRSGERIFGKLDFRSGFDSLAEAISANGTWTFKQVGCFSPHVTARWAGSNIDLVTCHTGWIGTER